MADEDGSQSQLSPAMLEAIQAAIAQGFAGLQPLEAPPGVTPLTITTTPKLGLKMPGLDDPALIQDINDNMVVLDNSITATQAVTLTNKTLDAPIINNPTITGWTNAQHTHLNAAGAGPLDGAAIATGTKGTGLLLRESGASGVALIDPVVRDTLFFGAEPTGTPDVSFARTGAGVLAMAGYFSPTLGIGVTPEAWPDPFRALRIGRSSTLYATTNADIVTLAANTQPVAGANQPITTNVGGGIFSLGNNGLNYYSAAAVATGVNQVWLERIGLIPPDWTFTVTPVTFGNKAIQANGWVHILGNRIELGPNGNNPSNGGSVRLYHDGGVQAWLMGHLATPSTRDFAIYDLVRSAQPFSITATNGIVNIPAAINGGGINNLSGGVGIATSAGGNIVLTSSGNYVHPNASGTLNLGHSSYVMAGMYGGYVNSGAGNLYMRSSGGGLICSMTSPYFFPEADAGQNLGYPSTGRWANLWIYYAPTVGSHASMKQDFKPLDPAACADAVLETDWVEYTYRVPTPSPRVAEALEADEAELQKLADAPVTDKERDPHDLDGLRVAEIWTEAQAKLATKREHLKYLALSEYTRHQKGYALGHETLKVADLFGLSNREERSDGADLAVVACALQSALLRIEALEVQVAGAA